MPVGIYKRTKKHNKNISRALKGHPMYKLKVRNKKISDSLMGNINKRGSKLSQESKKKISLALKGGKNLLNSLRLKGRKQSKNLVEKRVKKLTGQKRTIETRLKMSKSQKKLGTNHSRWKGGVSSENEKIRKSIEYHLWREAVFARDNWTCQKTGKRGGKIVPHHIKNFAQHPELRFAIDNGVTLSAKLHIKFHKKYGRKNNTKEQLEKFMKGGALS